MKSIIFFITFLITLILLNTSAHAQWVQKGIDIDGDAANDQSGRSISLNSDGKIIAVGAYKNNGAGTAAGHVKVYSWNGSEWIQKGADIEGEAAGDQSGTVALSRTEI